MKDISADAGLGDDIISCFLEEELVVYENNANDNNTIPWKLHVIEELLIVYKKTSSVSLQRAYLMIKKASIYYELNDKQQVQTPLQLVCEAIAILESMKGGSSEESCMMFDLLGHGYLWKAIILYSELIRQVYGNYNMQFSEQVFVDYMYIHKIVYCACTLFDPTPYILKHVPYPCAMKTVLIALCR